MEHELRGGEVKIPERLLHLFVFAAILIAIATSASFWNLVQRREASRPKPPLKTYTIQTHDQRWEGASNYSPHASAATFTHDGAYVRVSGNFTVTEEKE
jgi:hypothetical protein